MNSIPATSYEVDILSERAAGRCDEAGIAYYILLKSLDANKLRDIPALIAKVIERNAWKKWRWIGNEFSATSIDEYVATPPPRGLGASVELIQRLLTGKALEAFECALRGENAEKINAAAPDLKPVGRPNSRDEKSVTRIAKSDTAEYAIRRLRKDRPDIHARVLAGELSPNAGMIEAGFRKKSQRKKLSRVEREQRRIEQMTKSERRTIWQWLNKEFK